MKLGLRREPGYLRVDGDDLHAALHKVDHPMTIEAFNVRLQRIVAPNEHDFRHFVVGMIIALGELLGGVGNPRRARGGRHAGDARQIACLSGEEARVVGAAERPAQTRDVGSDSRPVPRANTTDSAPYFSFMSMNFSVMRSYASSHVIRSH